MAEMCSEHLWQAVPRSSPCTIRAPDRKIASKAFDRYDLLNKECTLPRRQHCGISMPKPPKPVILVTGIMASKAPLDDANLFQGRYVSFLDIMVESLTWLRFLGGLFMAKTPNNTAFSKC